jgi:hypothetical protein
MGEPVIGVWGSTVIIFYVWSFLNSPETSPIGERKKESEGNCGPAATLKTLKPWSSFTSRINNDSYLMGYLIDRTYLLYFNTEVL